MSSSLSVDKIRARIKHPIIDADGHTLEFLPAVRDHVVALGGADMAKEFDQVFTVGAMGEGLSDEEKRALGLFKMTWWGFPARNTLDRATAHLPRLLYQRLDEIGLDYAVIYPTQGLGGLMMPSAESRQVFCRAFNHYYAEEFLEFSDRMTPAALIPMQTPDEAIVELEYAVNTLGLKTAVVSGFAYRPLAGDNVPRGARWVDTFGLDSPYDYDPVWAKCVELGIAPSFHSSGMGWPNRASLSSYVYNHIGNFAAAGEATCRSLVLGGVLNRFPQLQMAFLEGGVGWATNLYADMISHWEKRSRDIQHYNPNHMDRTQLRQLFEQHGSERFKSHLDNLSAIDVFSDPKQDLDGLDEFSATGFQSAEDIKALFTGNLYFGCEADDPMNASAFNSDANPLQARLKPIFSSDIGHWDVPEMNGVVPEAYELVEDGLLTEVDFKEFVFSNDAQMLHRGNPDFFVGTAVEDAVKELVNSN